jgi:hypothetical protein
MVGQDCAVGIASRYGLEVRGSNPGGGEIFRTRPDLPWGPPRLLYNGGLFRGVKRPGRGVDHPPPPGAEIKERGELYFTSGPSWLVKG